MLLWRMAEDRWLQGAGAVARTLCQSEENVKWWQDGAGWLPGVGVLELVLFKHCWNRKPQWCPGKTVLSPSLWPSPLAICPILFLCSYFFSALFINWYFVWLDVIFMNYTFFFIFSVVILWCVKYIFNYHSLPSNNVLFRNLKTFLLLAILCFAVTESPSNYVINMAIYS